MHCNIDITNSTNKKNKNLTDMSAIQEPTIIIIMAYLKIIW